MDGTSFAFFQYFLSMLTLISSAENAMNYNRPTVGSLEAWASAVNDSSYSFDNFLPHFTASSTYTPASTTYRAANASVPLITNGSAIAPPCGPLQLSYPNWAQPFASWGQLALRELGLHDTNSQIAGQLIGSQYNTLTIDPTTQERSSSQTSYLGAAISAGRSNLQIYTHTLAERILFNDCGVRTPRASGVLVSSGPVSYTLKARKEVILSAGAFQSPQLLMISGIGPSAILRAHNITILADRPGVGQGMWDHVVMTFGQQVNVETWGSMMNATYAANALAAYSNATRTGIYTSDLTDYLAFEKLPAAYRANFTPATVAALDAFPADWPEIEYEISSAPFGTGSFSTPEQPIDVAYVQAVLIAPTSRGNVSISSTKALDAPVINPNWLTTPEDQQVAVAAFRRAQSFFATDALRPVLVGNHTLLPPQNTTLQSDAQILEYIQANLGFNWHASCTCRMGVAEDKMAVVDSEARVIGVEKLRVVDASAFALLPPGHPQSVVCELFIVRVGRNEFTNWHGRCACGEDCGQDSTPT